MLLSEQREYGPCPDLTKANLGTTLARLNWEDTPENRAFAALVLASEYVRLASKEFLGADVSGVPAWCLNRATYYVLTGLAGLSVSGMRPDDIENLKKFIGGGGRKTGLYYALEGYCCELASAEMLGALKEILTAHKLPIPENQKWGGEEE
ncbi:Uncharacterised protein [Escherichia coli]|uniref:hypothetical protein n=1 Tax=Escherichia coli TaxID=562 RepID=UPI000DA4ADE3|nr:hypothetical protein [Escherichia coli]EEW6031746.1 hypothetical protein [Escherichia coli]EGK3604454.1 hypothetical protein [Escherichia coli]MXF13815.1 hypothetical protein [Escherichia coli]SQK57775.1 Uncharacterised protein [Escherichia coli]SQY59294.1 Uncharacterised protein [Escherichia coli]